MLQAGLARVREEPFRFPFFDLQSSTLDVTIDGVAVPMEHEVFAYSGAGSWDAAVVCAGTGHQDDYLHLNPAGKVVLVERNPAFHRTSQYRLIAEKGGSAMLYVSAAPDDLIQTGTVRIAHDGMGPIPALTVRASAGRILKEACDAGRTLRAVGQVSAVTESRTGYNIVGRLPASNSSAPYIIIGAHYDTWHVGAADNGAGVAALLEMADALGRTSGRNLGVTFVAYDAEEIGLLGGYDFLRKHVVRDGEPAIAFLNFEGPAVVAKGGNKLLVYTSGGPMLSSIETTDSRSLYPSTIGLEIVPGFLGGIIPMDVQGLYRYGLQGISTAGDTPWYHTSQDTPDKIDVPFLSNVVMHFHRILDALDDAPMSSFQVRDPALYNLEVARETLATGLRITAIASDANKIPIPKATVNAWLGVDDFTNAWNGTAVTDASGVAVLEVPGSALDSGSSSRFLHVTAGNTYPLAEHIVPLP